MTVDEIVHEIDMATAPENMGLGEAMRFLGQLATEIECRIDGIKDDIKSNGETLED